MLRVVMTLDLEAMGLTPECGYKILRTCKEALTRTFSEGPRVGLTPW